MRELFAPLCFPVSALATITAWQEQLEWSLKILAALVAIAAGVAGFIHHRAKTREIRRSRRGQGQKA